MYVEELGGSGAKAEKETGAKRKVLPTRLKRVLIAISSKWQPVKTLNSRHYIIANVGVERCPAWRSSTIAVAVASTVMLVVAIEA